MKYWGWPHRLDSAGYAEHTWWNHYGFELEVSSDADCLEGCYKRWKENDYGRTIPPK